MADLSPLHKFLAAHPSIRHASPTDDTYSALRASFVVDEDLQPPLIVRPSCADHVGGFIAACAAHRIPFTVRAGGHDLFKRSLAADAVALDLRDLASVEVDHEMRTARIGGGILVRDLMMQLGRGNLATACATIPRVGYVGWAIHGGYGILSPSYGLGADQIVGAKVVTATGQIIEADERLLKGIRGGGGAFGVVVELTIRVYLQGQVLGGLILYGSPDQSLKTTITQFNDGYRELLAESGPDGLPPALGTHQAVVNSPQGPALGLLFLWASSDLEAGEHWRNRICSLAPLAMHTVAPTTVPEWLDAASAVSPTQCYGSMFSINVRELTPEVVDVISSHAENMPNDPPTIFGIHELRPCPATAGYPDSVFPLRMPHFMFEIFPAVETADRVEAARQWAQDLYDALRKTDSANLLPGTYLPFALWESVNAREIFLEGYDTLAELKREYDPANVFRYALARI